MNSNEPSDVTQSDLDITQSDLIISTQDRQSDISNGPMTTVYDNDTADTNISWSTVLCNITTGSLTQTNSSTIMYIGIGNVVIFSLLDICIKCFITLVQFMLSMSKI